jgi:outer membrane usher protein
MGAPERIKRRTRLRSLLGCLVSVASCYFGAGSAHAADQPVPVAATEINPTGHDVTLTVPLREYGPIGQVQITITKDSRVLMSANDLLNALARETKSEALSRLKAATDGNGQISLAAAAKAGFPIVYDPNAIELSIQIPVDALNARKLSFGFDPEAEAVQPDKSSEVAAFLNYRIGEVYQISGPDRGKFLFLGDLELGGRLGRTVSFDNFATIDQDARHPFTRTGSQLFYDLPGPAIRITAGDLQTQTTAFQIDPQISGINVSHLVSNFFPTFSTTSTSSENITLTRGADVQILVNNVPVSQLHLNPGTYNLRNLPLAQGANNMKAIITDDAGQRRVVNFSFFSDVDLLSPGIAEYTASLGILAPLGLNGPHYETDEPVFSGFYRRGLTNQLTAGFNVQADRHNQLFGVDAALGTRIGLFGANLAANHLADGSNGMAMRFQYRYAADTNSLYQARTFDLAVEYRSEHFSDISSINAINTEKLMFSADFNQPLTRSISFQLNGSYTVSREQHQDTGAISAVIAWQAPFETTLSAGATYQWAPKEPAGPSSLDRRGLSFLVSLTHRFGANTLLDTSASRFEQRADFNRSPSRPIDDYFLNGDFNHTAFGYSGNASAGYETNRGNIEGTYNTALNPNGSIASQQAGVFFDGSIDFAGGKIAPGRHINDSFAIVSGDPSLQGRQVIIQSQFAGEEVARSGAFGPAVVPIGSYNRQVVPYDVKDLPPGYDLGAGNFQLYPWYHAGYALKVGSPYNVTALGHMFDADGKPLSLRTGTAVSLTDAHAPHRDVITNRSGRFAAIGLSPGHWRITMAGGYTYDIEITKEAGMLVQCGNLRPAAGQSGGKP